MAIAKSMRWRCSSKNGTSEVSDESAGRKPVVSHFEKNACHSERSGVSAANGTQSRNLAKNAQRRLRDSSTPLRPQERAALRCQRTRSQHARSRGSSCSRARPSSWLCHPRGGRAAGKVRHDVRAVAPAHDLEFIPHEKSQRSVFGTLE